VRRSERFSRSSRVDEFSELTLACNRDRLSAGLIVAGWDPVNGGTVYNIPLGGGLFKGPWAIGGSGSTYIYGYCDATFREDWGQEETVEFVKNGAFSSLASSSSSLCLPLSRSSFASLKRRADRAEPRSQLSPSR